MKFVIEFTYTTEEREKLISFLNSGALVPDGPVKVLGAWIAVQTGSGYAVLDTKDSKAMYELCSSWSEYGKLKVTPVMDVAGL